jgi:hypothetical protein
MRWKDISSSIDTPKQFNLNREENILWSHEYKEDLFGSLNEVTYYEVDTIINRINTLIKEYKFDPRKEDIFFEYLNRIKIKLKTKVKNKVEEGISPSISESIDKLKKFSEALGSPIEPILIIHWRMEFAKSQIRKYLESPNLWQCMTNIIEILEKLKKEKINFHYDNTLVEDLNQILEKIKIQLFQRAKSLEENKQLDNFIEQYENLIQTIGYHKLDDMFKISLKKIGSK